MEASEKLNIPEETTVRVVGDRIVVEHLDVEDSRAAQLVRDRKALGTHPAETIAKAIEIGARVLDSEGTVATVNWGRVEYGRHAAEVAERLGKVIEVGNDVIAE